MPNWFNNNGWGVPQNNPYGYAIPQQPQNPQINDMVAPINQNQPQSSLIWVNGEDGAKNYPVAKGNTILLLDAEDSLFYLKSIDLTGVVSIRKFKFDEILNNETNKDTKEKFSDPEMTLADVLNKVENQGNSFSEILESQTNHVEKVLDEQFELIRSLEDKVNRLEFRNKEWKNKTKQSKHVNDKAEDKNYE